MVEIENAICFVLFIIVCLLVAIIQYIHSSSFLLFGDEFSRHQTTGTKINNRFVLNL